MMICRVGLGVAVRDELSATCSPLYEHPRGLLNILPLLRLLRLLRHRNKR